MHFEMINRIKIRDETLSESPIFFMAAMNNYIIQDYMLTLLGWNSQFPKAFHEWTSKI